MAAQHQPIIYVQTPDGTTVVAKPVDPLFRSEEVNTEFAGDWLQLAYTWKLPPENEKTASSIELGKTASTTEQKKASVTERGIDFPYQFYAASLAIEPGYREAFMDSEVKKYSRQFSFENYISGQNQSYIRIYSKKVVPVEKGLWDVMIVATRVHATGDTILAQEIFNRVIRQKAIDPDVSERKLWGERETHLGQLLNEMQHQGLQIVQVSEF